MAKWVELNAARVSAQIVQKPQGGRPEGGISAASRELGLDRKDASRAVKVASLSEEAKPDTVSLFKSAKLASFNPSI
ncbi:hypothetical protein [Brucella sp. 2280]|uniref:hypothetical protein n=1 Tax=Brucella sp. 2280 TaxID=2592625 RepID=UPI001295F361|nr:hypothetical protein [Brucella sp. 2280]QGA56863.1 hypothetical protein GHC20_07155 [Brucella sp. 2280]